ncbi:MAG: 2-succinyl-5-enolpyruvyl-6-hydroxy-3-cyclohexene-1-carboxylic-acid synthase [Myxococcota bacterium]
MNAIALLNRALGQACVAHLAAAGVERAVISPGSRNTPLVLAIDAEPRIESHVVLDERVAGFVALGMAKASGKPTLLLCTSGSAAAHYLPAVIEASHARLPLIIVSADRPLELHYSGAPQTTEQADLFGVHVRASLCLDAPCAPWDEGWLATQLARVVDSAVGVLPGPVHINIPLREPLWVPGLVRAASVTHRHRVVVRSASTLPAAVLKPFVERWCSTPRGLIVYGPEPGATESSQTNPCIVELAEALGWPVLADPLCQLRYGSKDSCIIGSYDLILRQPDIAAELKPDYVLRFGHAPTSKRLNLWLQSQTCDSALVDPCGSWHDFNHKAHTLLISQTQSLCKTALESIRVTSSLEKDRAWLERWQQAEGVAIGAIAQEQETFWGGTVAQTVMRCLPEAAALFVASSMPVRHLDSFTHHSPTQPRIYGNRGVNGIDGSVATALGISAVRHKAGMGPTVALIGDLALIHDAGGLLAAGQSNVPLTLVIINNQGGGIFRQLPISQHPHALERYFTTPQKVDLRALGNAAGAHYSQVENIAGLQSALDRNIKRHGLKIIEAKVDPHVEQQERQRVLALVQNTLSEKLTHQPNPGELQ